MAKKAAVINDLSGFGKCSLSAATAVLSVCGIQPCAVPTAIFTNQTGYPKYRCVDFTEHLGAYTEIWKNDHVRFDGIYSGYIANEAQIDFIIDFIHTFKTKDTLVLVDPVMGDNGKIYKSYNSEMCRKMGSLVKKADMITPNLTELCILSNKDHDMISRLPIRERIKAIKEMANRLIQQGCRAVVVTGIINGKYVYNYLFSENEELVIRSRYYKASFSGTGDLFASALFAKLLCGFGSGSALKTASEFIENSVADTITCQSFDPNDGVEFEKNIIYLVKGDNPNE